MTFTLDRHQAWVRTFRNPNGPITLLDGTETVTLRRSDEPDAAVLATCTVDASGLNDTPGVVTISLPHAGGVDQLPYRPDTTTTLWLHVRHPSGTVPFKPRPVTVQ